MAKTRIRSVFVEKNKWDQSPVVIPSNFFNFELLISNKVQGLLVSVHVFETHSLLLQYEILEKLVTYIT